MASDETALSDSMYWIMLALAEPLHGYGIMQRVAELSGGSMRVGPGTLYGALTTLVKKRYICRRQDGEPRRKTYALTALGRQALGAEVARFSELARVGRQVTDKERQT